MVIDSSTGEVQVARVFDTYKSSVEFDKFIEGDLTEGFIVIAACKDECTKNLSDKGRLWFANMGSKEIWKLEYRCGFAFIGISK